MKEFRVQTNVYTDRSMTVDKYLQEISKIPMLSPEEEARLAHQMHKGGREGELAKEKLINANLRFVVSVAKQYAHRISSGLTLSDLIEEGNMGLIHAAGLFDETKGFKFISYAVWWIRQSILQAVNEHSSTIRLPLNQTANLQKINKAIEKFEAANGRMPSKDEIMEVTGMEEGKLNRAMKSKAVVVGLDTPIGEDGDSTLADVIDINNVDPTDKEMENGRMKMELRRLLDMLGSRERLTLTKYFGLDGKEWSYGEIAERLNLTGESVRQIKNKALKKLREMTATAEMRLYL